MSKDTQLNIRVTKPLLEDLKAQAIEEVTTPSQLVRKAITIYIREAQHAQDRKRDSSVRSGV